MLCTYPHSCSSAPPSLTSTRSSLRMIRAYLSKSYTLDHRQSGRYCRTTASRSISKTTIIILIAKWNSVVTSWTTRNAKWTSTCPVSSLSSWKKDTLRRRSAQLRRRNHFSAGYSIEAHLTSSITSTWNMCPIFAASILWRGSQLVSIFVSSWILRLALSWASTCYSPGSLRKAWNMIALRLDRSPTQ